jgi:glycerophosphoryl diester phosphodiesterase
MRIIGHKGASGLALENTLASLMKAKEIGVHGVEFDVRMTSDRQLVLCHDPDMLRVSDSDMRIAEHPLSVLRKVKLHNGETIPTLREALEQLKDTWAIIDLKSVGCAKELISIVDEFPDGRITIATFHHKFAAELERLRPDLHIFLAENRRPTEIIHLVRTHRADGLDLNAWLLNPLTYWLARRHNLDIMVYTINNRFLAWFIHKLYPRAAICTDYPNKFIRHKV